MFILEFSDFSAISRSNDPSDPEYNPMFFLLDSTPTEPTPSSPAEILISLPSGNRAEEVTVTSSGGTANFWEFSLDNPSLVTPTWNSSITFAVPEDTRVSLWVRSNTATTEVPKDDRDVSIDVSGEVIPV